MSKKEDKAFKKRIYWYILIIDIKMLEIKNEYE